MRSDEDERQLERNRQESFARIAQALRAGVPLVVFAALDALDYEHRVQILAAYCRRCGVLKSESEPRCRCWHDDLPPL